MTVTAAGYQLLETVAESESRMLLRAIEPAGGPVVVKLLKKEHPGPEEVARLRHELEVAAALPDSCAVPPLRVEQFGNRVGLVLPDVGGVALSSVIPPQGFDPATFLDLATALTTAVCAIHEAGLIHRDLKPDNILVDPALSWVRVTDFGLATRLARSDVNEAVDRPIGTLAYLAPEQTGRMNRSVDQRSDLYSLGVTLYQMATGRLPFLAAGALELIHAHLAELPTDPRELNPQVPDGVAQILLRLLAKQPEDRYQSAAGLSADLSRAHRQWSVEGQVAPFELATADLTVRPRIPERLFGRDQELARLAAAVADAAEGRGTLVLLTGAAGVGKSALVAELGPVIAAVGARFVARKFDQYAQGFSPPTSLIVQFTRQVLSEPPERVHSVRRELEARVGPNLGVLTELAPELELVVGSYPPPVRLGPVETQQRFILAFTEFFAVFAKPGAPAVFLLDDLQWAKQGNVALLGTTLENELSRHTLVIGAYRPADVSSDHPLLRMLGRLDPARIVRIDVQPLSTAATDDLVRTTLGRAEPQLSAWLHELTDGNPFYLRQVLESLAEDGLLQAGAEASRVDLPAVRAHGLTGDIVEFLLNRFGELPEPTQRLLRVAALIGNRFSLDLLATAAGARTVDVAGALTPALRTGLLLTVAGQHELVGHAGDQIVEYRFRHDRVQQAVHSSIPVKELPRLHLAIGRLLRQQLDPEQPELFEVISHLGQAVDLLEAHERAELAELNLLAARRAKTSAFYDTVVSMLSLARSLLPPDAWVESYDSALEIHTGLGEALCVLTRVDEAEEAFVAALQHARSAEDAALIQAIRSESLFAAGRIADALPVAKDGLQQLGVQRFINADEARTGLSTLLTASSAARLAGAQQGDESTALRGRLWSDAVFAGYMSGSAEFVPVLVQAVEHLLSNGVTVGSTLPIAYLAMEAARTGHLEIGISYARTAIDLATRWDPALCGPVTMLAWCYCLAWDHDIDSQVAAHRESFWVCQNAGAMTPANYSLVAEAYALTVATRDQVAVVERWQDTVEHGRRYAPQLVPAMALYIDANQALAGLEREPIDRDEALAAYEKQGTTLWLLALLDPLRVAAVLGDYKDAYRLGTQATATIRMIGGLPSGLWLIAHHVGFAVAACRMATLAERPEEKEQYLAEAAEAIEGFRRYAECPPQPFLGYLRLIEAELARAHGESARAIDLYDAAIEEASKQRYTLLDAWANELLGREHLELGRRLGRAHLLEARHLYAQCAASGKVAQLDAEFPELAGLTGTPGSAPDLPAVLAGSQGIAAEVSPTRVIDALLEAAKVATGSDNGAFVSADGPLPASEEGTRGRLEFPLLHKGKLLGTLVLERPAPFGPDAVAALELLAPQAGISWENAALYADLEAKVEARSAELSTTATQLRAMQDQIVQSEKLAALGSLVAGVAHEINNPIGIAVSAASHLVTRSSEFTTSYAGGTLRRSELEEFLRSAADAADLILTNADRAAAMVAGFKQIAVDQAGEARREFALAAYLSDVVASLAPKLRGTAHRIAIDIDPDLRLSSYPGALAQVATNLVLNSLLHAYPDNHPGGLLQFHATPTDDQHIRLTYTDDGTGIPAADLPHIFEAFFTTRRGQGGSGLGLHIVHNLITQRLAGTITVTSQPDHGTQFDIELPVLPEDDDV